MKNLFAFLLLAVLAVNSGYGQAARTTRKLAPPTRTTRTAGSGPNPQQGPQRGPATTRRPVATRTSVVSTRAPVATRTTPSRQMPSVNPPFPTRATDGPPMAPTRAPNGPPMAPTRAPNGQPTPQQPGNWIPNIPNIPQAPIATTTPPRASSRPPLVGVQAVRDSRCPLTQDIRRPVQLAHATNCERFLKCQDGMAFEFQCPVGQHWNAARNYCDFPNNANCGGNNWNNSPNQPNWNNSPNQPNWNNSPNQPNWNNNPNQPNWNNSPNQPNWNNPSQPINPIPIPQFPDFQNPINVPMAPGK